MPRKPLRKYRNVRKPKKVYRRKPVMRTKNIARVVKNVLTRSSETKVQLSTFVLNPTSIQSGTSSLAGNFWTVNPSNSSTGYNIGRGTNSTQMIGNRIMLHNCKLKLAISSNAYNATSNPSLIPFFVRFYFYKNKTTPDADPTVAEVAGSGTFFENGPSYIGFSGNLMDLNRRMNSDNYTYLCHRTYKIGPSEPPSGATSTPFLSLTNNDFKLSHQTTLDITRFLPKVQVLNDNLSWQTPRVIMLVQVIPGIPAVGNYVPNTVLPCNIQCQIEYKFKDF